jgi:hypothetical protein
MSDSEAVPEPPPDAELRDLTARFLDDGLDAASRDRLEQRLKADPVARAYCAEQLRFAAALQESLAPQRIELVETRRMVLEKGGALVEQQRSVRYGDSTPVPLPGNAAPAPSRMWWRKAAAILLLLVAGGLAWHFLSGGKSAPESAASAGPARLELRNAGFEASDLSLSPRGISDVLENWSDGVRSAQVNLVEISRVSGGRIFAKSGKNVASFQDAGSINQRLQRTDGTVLTARQGVHVRISGWAYAEGDAPGAFICALRFIASGRPDMRLYEAARGKAEVPPNSWQPFSFDLKIAGNLMRPPYSTVTPAPTEPMLDLTGRELYLAVASRCRSTLLLDDLRIEEIAE